MNPNTIPALAAHGCSMPQIGFGTSQLGDCGDLVATALQLGYRHIDTAWKYGSEKAWAPASAPPACRAVKFSW